MKRCFVMFIFWVVMLIVAVITDNANELFLNEKLVESEIATENVPSNELVSEIVLKD